MAKIKLKNPIKKSDDGLKEAKKEAMNKVKSVFKSEMAIAKENEAGMPKYMVRSNIRDERKNLREAKKEIRKYKDY